MLFRSGRAFHGPFAAAGAGDLRHHPERAQGRHLGKYVIASNGKKYKFLHWNIFFDTLYGTFEGHGIKVNSYTDKHGRQCFGIIDNNGCGDMYTKEEFLNIFGKKD